MSASDYSTNATNMLRAAALRREAGQSQSQASFGFTLPAQTYERIRTLDVKVQNLDRDIQINVGVPTNFYASWALWKNDWERFRDKTLEASQSWNPLKTGPVVYSSDQISAQVDQYQRDLNGWYAKYSEQPSKDNPNKKVPPPSTPAPPAAPSPPGANPPDAKPTWWDEHNPFKKGGVGITDLIPWWVFAIGIVGGGLVAYSFYRTAKKLSADAQANEAMLRGVAMQQLNGQMGGALLGARDASPTVVINTTGSGA